VETCEAGAASLPFAPGTFDLVGTRYSAHHWLDLDGSLSEMRRVTRPGGTLLVIDVVGDADPLVDTHLQAMELLRDPGHVRNRDAGQWRAAIVRAGFRLQQEATFPVRLDFAAWIERMRTPPETAAAIRRLQDGAPRQVIDALGIGEDGSFMVTTGLFAALAR
jgi:SAM-dependent methyltransferase